MRLAVSVLITLVPLMASAAPEVGSQPAPESGNTEVVGGSPVSAGNWRDAAGVYFGPASNGPQCTGVLVAPNVVLTARHCLGGIQQVLLGATSWVEQDGEFLQVTSERAHPTLDIGALVLANDSTVPPRVIASGCVLERYLSDGADVAIVGYGATDQDATMFSTVLREAYTTVVDADCSDRAGCLSPGSEIGAGGNGIDSCNGDSGGPLYLLTEHYDYVVGVTSRAFSDATVLCSQGGIYVRPGAVIDWIEEVTQTTIPRSDCNTPPDPTVQTLEAESGEIGRARITPNDPEAGNTHRYEVIGGAQNGEAGVTEDGVAFYRSADDYTGSDSFMVRVTDDGVPALSSVVMVDVVVEEGGCGCRTSPSGSGAALWLVVVGLLAIRRRRR